MLEVYEKAPEVYQAAEAITDVMDWLTWQMTGVHTQTAGASGYKRMYQDGKYPDKEYLEALAPGFGEVFEQKMSAPIAPLGSKVGELTEKAASLMGLKAGITVCSGNIDAHVHAAGEPPKTECSPPLPVPLLVSWFLPMITRMYRELSG